MITDSEPKAAGPGTLTVFTGPPTEHCPFCGTDDMPPGGYFSYGMSGQGSYCDDCAEAQVPQEERDILEALNALDMEMLFALRSGADELRMVNLGLIVMAATNHLVSRYAPDANAFSSWIEGRNRASEVGSL